VIVPLKKKPVNSRAKGAAAELELAKVLTASGFPAERGQQRKGGADSPDVLCPSLTGFHIEAKITASCKLFSPATLTEWDAQAIRDSQGKSVPLVIHRWKRQTTWWVRVLQPGRRPYWQTLPDFLAEVKR
jgi:Holliday junction resolvase